MRAASASGPTKSAGDVDGICEDIWHLKITCRFLGTVCSYVYVPIIIIIYNYKYMCLCL